MKPEQQILNSILDYLAVRKIWHRRMNTGAMKGSHNGKGWFMRFGSPGMGDILATTYYSLDRYADFPVDGLAVMWFEVKAAKGKQSDAQIEFQKEVEDQGHYYFVVRSIDEVQSALDSLEAR